MRTLLLILLAFSLIGPAAAQGLKGAPSCPRSFYQPAPLIEGKSDQDRWAKFSAILPKLIGMKLEQLENALGAGKRTAADEIQYEIIESRYPSTPGTLATIELLLHFEKGTVHSYRVQAVHWGG